MEIRLARRINSRIPWTPLSCPQWAGCVESEVNHMSEKSPTHRTAGRRSQTAIKEINPGKSGYISLTGDALGGNVPGVGSRVAYASPRAPRRHG
jgi:hypothetical protein